MIDIILTWHICYLLRNLLFFKIIMSAFHLIILLDIILNSYIINGVQNIRGRLPHQVAFIGYEKRIDLSSFFRSEINEDIKLHYYLNMINEDTNELIDIPFWIKFDDTIPLITINAPNNITNNIDVPYGLKIMAKNIGKSSEKIAEEDFLLIIAKSCFDECPRKVGINCDNWESYMIFTGFYGVGMLFIGYMAHLWIYIWNEKRLIFNKKKKYYQSDYY